VRPLRSPSPSIAAYPFECLSCAPLDCGRKLQLLPRVLPSSSRLWNFLNPSPLCSEGPPGFYLKLSWTLCKFQHFPDLPVNVSFLSSCFASFEHIHRTPFPPKMSFLSLLCLKHIRSPLDRYSSSPTLHMPSRIPRRR